MKVNGETIKKHREAVNMSREELAIAADLTAQRIAQIEKGDGNINRNIVQAIARKLKLTMTELEA